MSSKTLREKATPRGTYPHIRRAGDYLFISGISARRADNSIAGAQVDDQGTTRLDIQMQTRAVIDNIEDILKSMDCTLADIVDVTTFLVNMNDFGGSNAAYAQYSSESRPGRTTVAVHQLSHPHLVIQIKATAYRPE